MRKKSILQVLFVFTVICFVTTSCDNNLTNVENIGNTNDENQSNEIPQALEIRQMKSHVLEKHWKSDK